LGGGRLLLGASALAIAFVYLVAPAGIGPASALAGRTPGSAAPAVTVTPNTLLANNQVVTVGWSAFTPTGLQVNPLTQYRNDDVAILECTANPPGGIWYFFRDCYTQGENVGGNIVSPSAGIQNSEIPLAGSSDASGTGSYPFQVQQGTLQTQNVQFPCGSLYTPPSCNNPYNIQCDISNACVLKVIDLPNGAPPIPNELWQGPPSPTQVAACTSSRVNCTYSQLIDGAPSVPLSFGPIPSCPAVTAGNLAIEGAASSSYALESWAADLCTGQSPLTISYADISEAVAKSDFLSGNTTVAVAAISPTAQELAAAGKPPSYVAAPLEAGGVSIVFNMVDPLTGLPIGCSANVPVASCATPVRLTPRLVAMLVTNSATLNSQEPVGHYSATAPPGSTNRFIEPLTDDPEFRALNPGFHAPAICSVSGKKTTCTEYVEEPVLRAERTDDTFVLTSWMANDFDAQRFLAGADPCGAQLNLDWKGASYPAEMFQQLAQTMTGTTPDSDSYYPVTGTPAVLQSLLYGIPVGGPPPAPGSPKNWLPAPADNYAFFGVMDSVSAHRSGLPSAQLIAANPKTSELTQFVTVGAGSCTPIANLKPAGFIADDNASLAEGYHAMTANADGTLAAPVTTTDTAAYPLAKIDYALVPTSGISLATANLVAALLRFSSGPGQTSQYLPPGYPPLPASLATEANDAATKVVQAATAPAAAPPPAATHPAGSPPAAPAVAHPVPVTQPGPLPTTGSVSARLTVSSLPSVAQVAQVATPPAPASVAHRPPAPARLFQNAVDASAAALRSGGWLLPLLAGGTLLFVTVGVVARRRELRAARTRKGD
jgi:hypothetical protein